MSENIESIHLVIRESGKQSRRLRREQAIQAAAGDEDALAKMLRDRGLVLRERENSIFSDAWIPIAVIILVVGLFNGRNTALLALGFVLLIVVGVSALWKNAALRGVFYRRSFDHSRVFPGEPIQMTIAVSNAKRLPLTWLQFRDTLPQAVEDEHEMVQAASNVTGHYILQNSFAMAGFEQTQRTFTLRFSQRGYYKLGPVTYASGDIFTLFTVEREYAYPDTLVVFPQIYPLEELGLPAKEPFGDIRVRRSLFTDPIKTQGIRDYQPGDRFRDVHWKATAVRGTLQTKVYEPSTGMTIAVFLNVATMPQHWMGFHPDVLERAISVAGSIANYGSQQNWGVGLYANGSVPNSDQPIRVLPGRAPEQLAHVLEALAAVTEFATGSIEQMLLRESPALPWVSTIVLVTAVVTDEIMVALIRLKQAGRRVVLLSLAEDAPPKRLGNIRTYHIPASAPAFQKEVHGRTATEAALSNIPTPEPVQIEFD